ncbi:MAG: hypothetical protein IT317_08440 [Anaerolineales bacterium]|nr:hypothetical protein [Anaerolineales bacterium]
MLASVQARLQRWASSRNVLLFLALFLLFEIVILPIAGARLMSYSGGLGPLDLTLGLSPADTYARLTAYTAAGRLTYLIIELTADVVFPIVYGLFFSLALALVFQRTFPPESALQRLVPVPLLALPADYLENAGIVVMLLAYPQELGGLALLVRLLTLLKWLVTTVAAVLLLIGLGALFVRRRSTNPTGG